MSALAKSEATAFIEEKAAGLAFEFMSMIDSMSPKQKEYVKKMAIIKASETTELSFDELMELSDMLYESSQLNLEITEELSGFWSKLGDIAKESALKFGELGVKLAAKSIVGFLPI